MKIYKKKSIILDSNNKPFNKSSNKSLSKMLSKKEYELDYKINNLANDINQKLLEGKRPEDLSIKYKYDIDNYIPYILDQNKLYMNYVLILNQYLYFFPLLEIFTLPESFINKNDLFNNVSLILKKENVPSNKIIYLNGQLGKKFYIILEGKVTILNPVHFYIRTTYEKFYQYMEFLLLNSEYELIRYSFDSNKNNVNEKKTLHKDKFYKFNELLDRNIISDIKQDLIDDKTYIEKFDNFFKENFEEKKFLNEKEKKKYEELEKKEEEEEMKEKEYEEEKEKIEDEEAERRITGNDAENDRYEILDKIRLKQRESVINFYKKRLKKKIVEKEKVFVFWKYHNKNITLKKGDYFSEIALRKNDNKIKSTIITKTDCTFCIIERDEYRNLINEFVDNARRINIDSLMHSKLFYNYNSDLFNMHYYSYFIPIKKIKGDYIFRQNEIRTNIYFIKNGSVQVEYFSSLNDLDKILDKLTVHNTKMKKNFNKMIIPHEQLETFLQKKQKFNIFNYINGEIAGTNEICYPNTNMFMFDAICISDCEIFSLDLESLKNIISERIIRKNYNELNIIKKEKLIQRILTLKSNVIFQFNRFVNPEKKIQTTERSIKKANSILSDKSRNQLTLKSNIFSSSTNIKKEIINSYNSERKSKNKGNQLFKLKKPEPLIIRNNFIKENVIFNNRKLKLLEEKNQSSLYLKTERIDNKKVQKQKIMINFSLKGRVPKLLINKVNTVNKVIDKLISKEKDLFDVNNSAYSKKTEKNCFINHLDILSFDNYMNKIETNLKQNKEENKNQNVKKINKLLLSPISLKKGINTKYSSVKKKKFRKDIFIL